ncbi:LPP20 family lipoprotein [Halanaerobacter jeridensis]|uniref:LPP20 lipoprotein n=1 Tax=Halanaerobacter jeridensis TaxID=706427 RepID=A0A938XU21_9FIRM|nr:hypothetical protein [Halanaerobacter jeridensis]MBM7557538.1 hypothetical protein [Halanaerobacter jeridensis]
MKNFNLRLFCFSLGLMIIVIGVGVVQAEASLFNSRQDARTDWQKSVVRAKGYGVVGDEIQNKAQAKILAREAAITMAQRHLLEEIKGVNLTATQTIKNAQVESDVIKKKLNATLRGARIVEEKQPAKGTYLVIMEVKFYGRDGVIKAILPKLKEEAENNNSEQLQLNNNQVQTASTSQQEKDYTGIIINTINVDVEPAIAPNIYSAQGKLIYGISTLNTQEVITSGIVGYERSLNAARANPRVGQNPLVIKAQDVRGSTKSDLVVATAQAKKMLQVGRSNNIFNQSKVIIVLN